MSKEANNNGNSTTSTEGAAGAASNAPAALSEAEVNARIEQARKEEKQKLYAEIEKLRAQVNASSNTEAKIAELNQQLDAATQQVKLLSVARTPTGEINIQAAIHEAVSGVRTELSAQHNKEVSSLRDRLTALEQEKTRSQLDSLRRELISAANGRIIAAMVTGNTEEEIRASVESAKQTYEDTVKPFTANQGSDGSKANAGGNSEPPPAINSRSSNGGNGTPPVAGLDAFKRPATREEYKANRSKLLTELKGRYS